ncbi:hypothetical protein L596_026725 [Steinernema carpocapsae]|uniref:7TM GPCR serpentine receptor class x (Srx) domain-containing protein n=1 Tax=Steinernema carpocapsae TaxID=34508 RepID=A0A4U5M291_STECR|nr:hypothetical protein L596_026725 [Steinernema carpocapsae]
MINIGIVQCCMGPGVFLLGLIQVLNQNPWNIATYVMRMFSSVLRMEACMSFVLALNRLKVICQLKYRSWIHNMLLAIIWLLGILNYCLLYTPWAAYNATPGVFSTHYDLTKPYSYLLQQTGSYFMMTSFVLTFIVYTVICVHLLKIRKSATIVSSAKQEQHILVYAVFRFVIDVTLAVIYNYGGLPPVPIVDFPIIVGNVLNNLLLPPALYLTLNRSLRKKFFSIKVTSNLNTVNAQSSNAVTKVFSVSQNGIVKND